MKTIYPLGRMSGKHEVVEKYEFIYVKMYGGDECYASAKKTRCLGNSPHAVARGKKMKDPSLLCVR